ncbi:MAG: YaaA family protein [Erysipelotrichaceae bacterium]|nr:YaaA family protein [Erysipelotrichaceae bacterium]
MIVLLSPTKTMKQKTYRGKVSVPVFIDKTNLIADEFKKMSRDELYLWYNASDTIVEQAFLYWQEFHVQSRTIALYAYQGESFRNFNATTLTKSELTKVNKHLRILSALYGLLRPLDQINMYRLDLSKNFPQLGNGVNYWRDVVTDQLIDDIQTFKHQIIINCSSNEYTEMIDIVELRNIVRWIQVNFVYIKNDQRVNISMLAKAARGTLARELSLKPVSSVSQMNRYLRDYVCEIDKKQGIVTYVKHI